MAKGRSRICNIEVTEEQYLKLRHLPYGSQKRIFKIIVDGFLELLEQDPAGTIGGLLTRDLGIKEILKGAKDETGGSQSEDRTDVRRGSSEKSNRD